MPLYRAREGDVGARLLREPASHSQGARTALNSLRRVTHDMGGVWPYFNEQGQAPRQALQDFQDEPESDSGMEAEVTVLFTALTPGYAPETFTANLHIPATYVDAENAFRAARAPLRTRLFPHVIDASPQPLAGHAVFVCCPYWLGISLVVCIDLLQLDGRVFAVRAPPYCDRHRLLQLAALQANAPVDVFAGFYEDPLPDGVDIHLFPGETIRFVQSGQLRTPPASLTQLLLDVTVAGPAASADYRAFKYVCHRDGPVLQRPAGQLDPGDPDFVPFAAVFAVYAPDRVPLSVELALFGTESADAVLRTINAMRGAYDRGPLPGLMIVAPQPDPSHGIVLAVPDWQPPGVFVFFDCRHLEDRAFVALVPAGLDRAGILTIAGIDPSLNVRVYVRDAPHPLEPDFVFALQRGDLVQIAGPSHPPLVLAYFSDMIGDRASWEGAASPPGRYDARHWVVSEDGAFPVVPHPRGGETFRQQVAAEIGS
eukprot:s190_g3.t1